ncbi:MAG: hypothetical protein AAF728_00255 [Cyanobacteria bacterium P01_D01_bin.128]
MSSLLPVVFLIIIWVILFGFMLTAVLAVRDGIRRLKRLHQIPCYRCRYYTGSYHLKCPVNPLTACSEDAIACQDYELRQHPRKSQCNLPKQDSRVRYGSRQPG